MKHEQGMPNFTKNDKILSTYVKKLLLRWKPICLEYTKLSNEEITNIIESNDLINTYVLNKKKFLQLFFKFAQEYNKERVNNGISKFIADELDRVMDIYNKKALTKLQYITLMKYISSFRTLEIKINKKVLNEK